MKALEVPSEITGQWDNLLILTYTWDIPFLEVGLWSQLTGIRNKLVLADDAHYLEACVHCAHGAFAKRLNREYVAGGIFIPQAAHAKVVLLTTLEQGRLLVGSGNLGLPGYASGGELFTRYEYPCKNASDFGAFITVREVIEGLVRLGYVKPEPRTRLQALLEGAPWLFGGPPDAPRPVRHNLERSHLEQLSEVIEGDPVHELRVLSPFYDPEAVALDQLLGALRPRKTTILVQPGATSIEPDALRRVCRRHPHVDVRPFRHGHREIYVHAKLCVAKLARRAVCLQGSPNLSQAAMLLPVPQGNLEVANLLVGDRDDFDYLFESLSIDDPVADVRTLNLRYVGTKQSDEGIPPGWALTGGEWRGRDLWLDYDGSLPDLRGTSLRIGDRRFPCQVRETTDRRLRLKISDEAAEQLERLLPVYLAWDRSSAVSNPIYLCDLQALEAASSATEHAADLSRVGDLSLDDPDLEYLLLQLSKTLVVDRRDIWALAGRQMADTEGESENDEDLRIDYAAIDYDAIRRHPRLRQYAAGIHHPLEDDRSRVQIILRGITQHFQARLTPFTQDDARPVADQPAPDEVDVEAEEGEEQEPERHRSAEQRIQRLLRGFIRRYLRGIQSDDFQQLVGYEVMVQNYIIFSHILWRLLVTDRLEEDFLLDAQLRTWTFFWGSEQTPGYLRSLSDEERRPAESALHGYYAESTVLAALYWTAEVTADGEFDDLAFQARAFLRDFLCTRVQSLSQSILEKTRDACRQAFALDPPTSTEIVCTLAELAYFDTDHSFLERIESAYGYPRSSCSFEPHTVYQRSKPVDCLTISAPTSPLTKSAALSILYDWMHFDPSCDYYRITAGDAALLIYDTANHHKVAWTPDRHTTDLEEFDLPNPTSDLDIILSRLRERAAQADQTASRVRKRTAG